MLLGRSSVVRGNYISFKLQKETHALWIGIKRSLGSKIDGVLACHLLNTTETGSNMRKSMEVNDLNQSKVVHFSNTVRF